MKRLLIISPYFSPVNTPDMQRIRMSLPYYKNFGWEAEVVMVNPIYTEMPCDSLLQHDIPADIKIHCVKALPVNITRKFGLGSIALRSLLFYRKRVDSLMQKQSYQLIYFSTTQFPVCILGPYWKKRFGTPYVIDMQDPWHSDFYQDKPREQRPAKYWFSYRLNRMLEPLAMKEVAGLISVSQSYIDDLQKRYPRLKSVAAATIPFGFSSEDFRLAFENKEGLSPAFNRKKGCVHVVYAGRGGHDLMHSIGILLRAFKQGLITHPTLFNKIRFHFIGTSYAPSAGALGNIRNLARALCIDSYVEEITGRISLFQTICTLQEADLLFLPGSADAKYNPSKLCQYMLAGKPILSVMNEQSIASGILKQYHAGTLINAKSISAISHTHDFLLDFLMNGAPAPNVCFREMENYSAPHLTQKQCELFDKALIT